MITQLDVLDDQKSFYVVSNGVLTTFLFKDEKWVHKSTASTATGNVAIDRTAARLMMAEINNT